MNNDIIDKDLQFYTFNDFFKKKEKIKEKYQTLGIRDIKIYKLYVYSLCWENEHTKDIIWEYLNNDEKSLSIICIEYRNRQRRKKWRKYNAKN